MQDEYFEAFPGERPIFPAKDLESLKPAATIRRSPRRAELAKAYGQIGGGMKWAPVWILCGALGLPSGEAAAQSLALNPLEIEGQAEAWQAEPALESTIADLVARLDQQEQELKELRAQSAPLQELGTGVQQLESGLGTLEEGVTKLSENLRVTTVDKQWSLAVFGSLNGEMLLAERRPFLPSGVTFLFPDLGRDTRTFELHGKSTNINAALVGPEIGGLKAGGLLASYLYGEQFEADRYGFFVVRAYGELKNECLRLACGLDGDVINPRSPTTLNYNAGNLAGNLGFFRGQARVERYFHPSGESQVTTQFALSNPITTSFAEFDVPPNHFVEDNGWPNLEGRVAWGLGAMSTVNGQPSRPFEVGLSGLVGELRVTDFPGPNQVLDTWAYGADLQVALLDCCGVRGEFFSGQSIGNYNAAILQVRNDALGPVRSTGGWGECYLYWTPCLHSHVGYGVDDPLDSTLQPGLAAARPSRNQFLFGNLIWDVTRNLELGLEVSHWETSYLNVVPVDIDSESMVYHTRVRIKY